MNKAMSHHEVGCDFIGVLKTPTQPSGTPGDKITPCYPTDKNTNLTSAIVQLTLAIMEYFVEFNPSVFASQKADQPVYKRRHNTVRE
jgi:hypothetical protein